MLPLANLATEWITASAASVEAMAALTVAAATYKKTAFGIRQIRI
jgi:hypothetical protein